MFLASCSNGAKKTRVDTGRPDWILNAYENCKEDYICTVGEGFSMSESFANARSEIAKQFSVRISSSFNSSISQKNDKIDQTASSNVNENVNEIINGIEIDKSFYDQNDKLFYALAILDKNKMSQEVKKEIDNIDKQLQHIISNKPVNVKKAEKLLAERSAKEKKYSFLTGEQIKEKITKKDILQAKSEPTHYKLEITDNENFGLKDIMTTQITDNKDVVDNTATKTIVGKVNLDKSYLRVAGFEKYEVDIVLKCIENKETIGQIHIKMYETGRNKQQVIDKVKKPVIMQISDSIEKLLV